MTEKEIGVNTEAQMSQEQEVSSQSSVVEQQASSDAFAKGRERMASVGKFFTGIKESFTKAKGGAGERLTRFWNKTKNFGGEAVAATLSADVLAKQGYEYTADKISQADKFVSEKANEAGQYLGRKGAEAYDTTKDFIVETYKEQKELAQDFIKESKEFAKDVAIFTQDITNQGIEVAKDVTFAVKEKTVEGFNRAKEGVAAQYNNVVEFGEKSIMAAKMKAAEAKTGFRKFMYELRLRRLEARIAKGERAQQKAQDVKTKMNLLSSLDNAVAA